MPLPAHIDPTASGCFHQNAVPQWPACSERHLRLHFQGALFCTHLLACMRMYTAARWHKQATELEQELHFRGQSAGVLPSNCQARYLQVVRGKDRYFSLLRYAKRAQAIRGRHRAHLSAALHALIHPDGAVVARALCRDASNDVARCLAQCEIGNRSTCLNACEEHHGCQTRSRKSQTLHALYKTASSTKVHLSLPLSTEKPAVMYRVAWPSVKFGNGTACLDACEGQHSELRILCQCGQGILSEDQSWNCARRASGFSTEYRGHDQQEGRGHDQME